MAIKFEWDENKNVSNRAKHGISFEEAASIWLGITVTEPDERDDDEDRYITTGTLANSAVLLVVHTERSDRIRIISARKATPQERKGYFEKIHRPKW